jgi:pilus assembly protein Flp/PilA
LRRSEGVTAIEYGIVAALIATVIIGAVNTLGQNVYNLLFEKIATSL